MQNNGRNLQTRKNYTRIYNAGLLQTFFIPPENDPSLNNRRVKCKQTEENYSIFHSFSGNAEFCRFFRVSQTYAGFCRKMQTIFFP